MYIIQIFDDKFYLDNGSLFVKEKIEKRLIRETK